MILKYIYIIFVFSIGAKAQNLISNGNFEQYNMLNCVTAGLDNVTYWSRLSSPDYYTTQCNGVSGSSGGVPSNFFGYSYAKSGHAYIGIASYYKTEETKEYIYQHLNTPLIAGKKYYTSFYASLSDRIRYSIKNIGIYFSVSVPVAPSNTYVNAIPQVENQNGFLTDTAGWMKIEGFFTAIGGEEYITIGNFNSNLNTDTLSTETSNPFSSDAGTSYYYIDSVSLYDSLALPTSISELENEPKFNLYPNPNNGKMYLDYDLKNDQNAVIRIFDVTGKVVGMYNLQQSTGKLEINEQNLNNGVYYYSILSNGNVTKTDKIIIIK